MEDEVPLSVIQEFVDEFRDPGSKGSVGKGNRILFQATVVSHDMGTQKVTVLYDGQNLALPVFLNHNYVAGDVVWGIQEGNIKIIIGRVNAEPRGLIAWEILNASTPSGYPVVGGSGYADNFSATTTRTGTGLWITNIGVTPGRLLEIEWQLFAIAAGSDNLYFDLYISENGGTYQHRGRQYWNNQTPSALIPDSPQGSFLYKVPAGVTGLHVGLDVTAAVGTNTVFRWATWNSFCGSTMKIFDVGKY